MKRIWIKNATLVNEGRQFVGSVLIEGEQIAAIVENKIENDNELARHLPAGLSAAENGLAEYEVVDAEGCYLLPGAIDEHVHFRDPGLTHKADIFSESRAAAAGGVTSIMDMPNTKPQTTTIEAFNEKLALMAKRSSVNYSCYFGATNDNYPLFAELDRHRVCGVKLFMGASTGNMLVDQMESLQQIFNGTDLLIAAHCEDQSIVKENSERYKEQFGEEVPVELHPAIRSEEACYRSTLLAVELARQSGARLHVLHLSTAKELELFSTLPLEEKRITAEACVSHLFFEEKDYGRLGARIKCNPAVKTAADRQALVDAVNSGVIDAIATDHAPHLLEEKEGGALKAVSGMPMIQFSLVGMLELAHQGKLSVEKIVEKMAHAPAVMYQIARRGFIREGYQADLVLVRPDVQWTVTKDCIVSKCGWSPLEGTTLHNRVEKTFVNGHLVYNNGQIDEAYRGQELYFEH